MSTTIRPEISEKNPYWIDKHRFYELKHFCLQYPRWKKAKAELDSMTRSNIDIYKSKTNDVSKPVEKSVEDSLYYSERMELIEKLCNEASIEFGNYLFKAVTEGYSYNYLKTTLGIPCCKEIYYDCYRRFFWLLSKVRK